MTGALTSGLMSPAIRKVVDRARREPEGRFHSLAHLLDVPALAAAYWSIRKDAAVGVDGVTKDQYGQDVEQNLQDLYARLRSKRYRHQPIRRVHIPKDGGRTRPIGISALEDKIVQSAVRHVLKRLDDQFTAGWFPLANNVEKLSNSTEKAGLGQTILQGQGQHGNVRHAQASSYLGVVLEDLGLATWNGLHKGIQWRLIRKPPSTEELARLIARRVSDACR